MPPARRTPSGPAPVLKVQPETLHVGEPVASPANDESPSQRQSHTSTTAVQAPPRPAHPVTADQQADERINIAKTLRFYADTERRMVTVTALGAITPGLPSTITEFVNNAFDLYLQKLADEHNDGQPYPMAPAGSRAPSGPRPR